MNTLEARRRLLGRNVYKHTTEGNPAIAQGSLARRYPGITMQGWTKQVQYEGENLFDFSSCSHGLLDWSSGLIETVRYNQYYHSDYVWLSAGTYYIKVNGTGTTLYSYIWCDNDKQYVGGKFWGQVPNRAFTIESDCYVRFAFASSPLVDVTETYLEYAEKANIMLNAGSTALPYEPYTGGQPSPSPDYPQPITSAGKHNEDTGKWEYEIEVTGANLFDGAQFGQSGKVLYVESTFGNRDITGIDYKQNTAYTISIESYEIIAPSPSGDWSVNFTIYYTDGSQDQRYTKYLRGNPLTSNKNKTILRMAIENPWNVEEKITGIVINEGAESLPTPQTVTLTADRPLTKWDKLEKRNGQWGWVYKSAEKVLDGTEGYVTGSGNYISDFSSNCYTVISDMVSDGRDNAFMNRLSNIDYSWVLADAIGFSKNLDQLHVRISNADLGTTGESSSSEVTAAMKSYMAQQYEEGNPFIFWYETAEETFVPLSSSEQEQMNELYTFRPTTVLSNDCECNMTLTYKTKKSLQPVSGGGYKEA